MHLPALIPAILSIFGLSVRGQVRTISCDFNSNFCGWTNIGSSLFTITYEIDTLSSFNGSFVATSSKITSDYLLSSIPLPATLPQNTSIAFWYSFRKGYEGIYLRVLTTSGSVTIWERRTSSQGVQDVTWAYVEFPVAVPHGATLQFAAAVKKEGGLVALDEFVYFGEGNTHARPGRRHLALSCDFSSGFCDWSNQESASAKFKLIAETPGIIRPHLFTANTSTTHLTVARLFSPWLNILNNTKIILTYEALVSKHQTELLIVSRRKGGQPSIVTTYTVNSGPDNLKASNDVRIGIEVFLRPGQSVQLWNVYVANEAETLTDSDGCSDVEPELLQSDYPHTRTVSCSFDRNLCGWQLSPQDTNAQVIIAREVFHVKNFVRVPHVGEGAVVIQSVPTESPDIMPFQMGPLLSPDIVQLRPAQLFFYYYVSAQVNYAFLNAEYANGTRITLWSFKQRTQGPPLEQSQKWLPIRLRFCLPGRFQLAFHVLFKLHPPPGFWLDELTFDDEGDSVAGDALSVCSSNSTQSPTSLTCDSNTCEADATSFCGWRCVDSDPNIFCNTTYVTSTGAYSPQMALKIDASGMGVTNGKSGSVISPPLFVEPESQLVLTYIARGQPVRFTVLARDSGTSIWETVQVFSFAFDIAEWFGMNVHFPKQFHRRTIQLRLLVEFFRSKPNPPFPAAFFAVSSIWYTTENGYTMAKQTDSPPFAETCNRSSYANITCDFQGKSCDWNPIKYGVDGWSINSGRAILNGTLFQLDKSTRELQTKYHHPLSSRLRFSYLLLGSGYAVFSLVTETPRDNRFRLWKAPAGPIVGNALGSTPQWKAVEMDLCLKFPFTLTFQAAVIHGNVAIMLDEVTLQDECDILSHNVDCPVLNGLLPPDTRTPTETELKPSWSGQPSCDFEDGHLCDWHNNDPMQLQWHAEKDSDAWKKSYVAKLSWNSQSLSLPAFSYLVSPRLNASGARMQEQGSHKVVLQFSLRLSDIRAAYVELYFAKTGILAPEAIIWSSHSRADELRTSWVLIELDVPDLDAANINQLVFAVIVLDSHGFVLLDGVDLLAGPDDTSQVSLGLQGVFLLLLILAVPTVFGFTCFVIWHRNKVAEEARQLLIGLLPRELVERFEQPFWLIKFENQCIGEGRFGQVQLGWIGNRPVAVKRMRRKSVTERDRFLGEMAVYIKIGQHRNIVELLGVTVRGEFTIIMEYCHLGCLLSYLKREFNFPQCSVFLLQDQQDSSPDREEIKQLTAFAHDVARGMVFLSNIHIVHGDIAARNVLLDQNKRAKITDFGRTKFEGDVMVAQENSLLPAQWMPPELLLPGSDLCSCRSDVWSFGILVWEIFTLGARPYGHFIASPNVTCEALFDHLKAGLRLPLPRLLPETVYDTVNSCWQFDWENRPPITAVMASFAALLPCETNEMYISCEKEDNEIVRQSPTAAKN